MDPRTEAAVERWRKALVAKCEADAREQKAHDALMLAKSATINAHVELAEAQNALRARLLAAPEPEPEVPIAPPAPAPAPTAEVPTAAPTPAPPAPMVEVPTKKTPAGRK